MTATQAHTADSLVFLTKKAFIQQYPGIFTLPELDYLIRIRTVNGFVRAVRKVGPRKILINVPEALSWIDSQNA